MKSNSLSNRKIRLTMLILAPVLMIVSHYVSGWSSFIAVALGWIWFTLPGYLISYSISKKLSLIERIPLGFILAIGISAPCTIVAILLKMPLSTFIVISIFIYYLALVIFHILDAHQKPRLSIREDVTASSNEESFEITEIVLILMISLCALFFAYVSSQWSPAGDDISGLAIFSETLRADAITNTEPFHGSGTPSTPRNELIVWVNQNILVCKIANVAPPAMFMNSRSLFILLSFAAFYGLLHQLLDDRRKALYLMALLSIYLLGTMNVEGMGNDLITRIVQDKFFSWFVVVPVLLMLMHKYVQSNLTRHLIGFAIGTLGIAVLHPISLGLVTILAACLGLTQLIINPISRTARSTVLVTLTLTFCLVIPVIQYLRYVGYFPIEEVGLKDAVEYTRISMAVSRNRLWLLDGDGYILHPAIITAPIILISYLCLIPLTLLERKKPMTIFMGTSMIVMAFLFYIPPIAKLVGKFTTPYLLWRLAWPLPVFGVFIIGLTLLSIFRFLKRKDHYRLSFLRDVSERQILPLFVGLAILIAIPSIRHGWLNLKERVSANTYSVCSAAKGAIEYLDKESLSEPINVLASHQLNLCIPAGAAWANVIEFRGYGTINRLPIDQAESSLQRVIDVNYFSTTTLIDQRVLDMIKRYDVQYVVINRDQLDLDLQLRSLEPIFIQVYSDQEYAVFRVANPVQTSPIITGNSLLSSHEWEQAEVLFGEILNDDPQSFMALFGLGKAKSGQGQNDEALAILYQALDLNGSEPALYETIGNLALISRDVGAAKKCFKDAVELVPTHSGLYISLAQAHILSGETSQAIRYLEEAAGLVEPPDTSMYYSELGNLLSKSNLLDEAVIALERAAELEPSSKSFVELGNALARTGESENAKRYFKKAGRQDPWSYGPHLQLGIIFHEEGDLTRAVQEYERSLRLNPTHELTYIKLGQAIWDLESIEAAIKRLEDQISLNSFLPGPYSGLIPLYLANGQTEATLYALENNIHLQPRHAGLISSEGFVLMALGLPDEAFRVYEDALLIKPDLVSAHLGLSMLYTRKLDLNSSLTHLYMVCNELPTESWPHILIAQTAQQKGDWDTAEAELTWAYRMNPESVQTIIALGDFYQQNANLEQAKLFYSHALEFEPGNTDALLRLALVYEYSGELETAQAYLERAYASADNKLPILLKYVELLWSAGKAAQASELIDRVAEEAPESGYAWIQQASFYKKEGNFEKAAEAYHRAVQVDLSSVGQNTIEGAFGLDSDLAQDLAEAMFAPTFTNLRSSGYASVAAGDFFLEEGQYEEAENIYRAALSIPYSPPEVYQALSVLHRKLGQWDKAYTVLQAGVVANPYTASAYYYLGTYLLERGELDSGKVSFEKSIALQANYPQGYIGLAQIYQFKDDLEAAEEILLMGLEHSPYSAELYLELAAMKEKQGEFKLAEDKFKSALRLKPSDSRTVIALSQFYVRRTRIDEALSLMENSSPILGSEEHFQVLLGDLYSMKGNDSDALDHYQKAFNLDRSNPEALIAITKLHINQNEIEAAFSVLDNLMDTYPNNVDVKLTLAELCQLVGDYRGARELYASAVEDDRSRLEPLLALGELAMMSEDWDSALSFLNDATEVSPLSLEPYYAKVTTYTSMGLTNLAENTLDQLISQAFNRQDAYLARADYKEMIGKTNEAQNDYLTAWSINPTAKDVSISLSHHYRRYGYYEEALKVINGMIGTFGLDVDLKVELSKTYLVQGDWASAEAALEMGNESTPSSDEAILVMADLYKLRGQNDEAIELYLKAIESGSKSDQVYMELGEEFIKKLDYTAAFNTYAHLLALNPDAYEALLQMERIGDRLGNSQIELKPYLELANNHPSASLFDFLAEIYRMRGQWVEAHYWLDHSIRLYPTDAPSWYLLAKLFAAMGEFEDALEAANQSIRFSPGNLEYLVLKGTLQHQLGLTEEAISTFQYAIDLYPTRTDAYLALAKTEMDLEQMDLALETLNRAVSKVPADEMGYIALANANISNNNPDKAMQILEEGLNVIPGSTAIRVTSGDIMLDDVIQASNTLGDAETTLFWAEIMERQYKTRVVSAETSRRRHLAESKLWDAVEYLEATKTRFELAQESYDRMLPTADKVRSIYMDALNSDHTSELALLGLGRLEFSLGHFEEGLSYYKKSVERNSGSILSLSYLAYGYLDAEMADEAIPVFRKIIWLEPSNLSAQAGLYTAYEDLPSITVAEAAQTINFGRYRWEYLLQQVQSN